MGGEEKAQWGLSKYFLNVFDESVRMFNTCVRTALGNAETIRGQWSLWKTVALTDWNQLAQFQELSDVPSKSFTHLAGGSL